MKKLLLLLILSVTITACKKRYEEGPLISLRSAMDRITGVWKLEYAEMNGSDVSIFIDSLEIDSFRFTNEKESFCGSDRCKILEMFSKSPKYCYVDFHWALDSGKKNLFIGARRNDCPDSNLIDTVEIPLPYLIYGEPYNKKYVGLSGIWTIHKLTMGKMWLENYFLGNNYKTHFRKIREIDNGI